MHQELISLVNKYEAPKETLEFLTKIPLVAITGVSGAGKNTTIKELLKTNNFCYIISYTTRKPRINNGIKEKNGREYFFITEKEAIKMLTNKEFIESAITHENFYGTAIKQFQEAYKNHLIPISDIDVKGVDLYQKIKAINKVFFLLPPDIETQISRIKARYSNKIDQTDYKIRIKTSIEELQVFKKRDYFIPIINDHKEETTKLIIEYLNSKKPIQKFQNEYQVADRLIKELKSYYKTL